MGQEFSFLFEMRRCMSYTHFCACLSTHVALTFTVFQGGWMDGVGKGNVLPRTGH